jgi:hypothetical protein
MPSSVSSRADFQLGQSLRPICHPRRWAERRLVQSDLSISPSRLTAEIESCSTARDLSWQRLRALDFERLEAVGGASEDQGCAR